MKVKFWGTRGSIASPGPTTIRYGGNTTCIEVRTDAGDVIVLDAGTGVRALGLSLLANLPVHASVFISHTHWDHIQGLPFFVPLFIPNNTIDFYGAFDPIYGKDIQSILSAQMEYCYFPVRQCELKANISYTTLREGDSVQVGSATVSTVLMNHPVLTFGYRIDADGQSLFFSGDHEPLHNIYAPDDEYFEEYQGLIEQKQALLVSFMAGVDLAILDAMYTREEYPTKIGWGHGTFESTLRLAQMAKAKHIVFTHHEPTRSDDALDETSKIIEARLAADAQSIEATIATEGMEIQL